MGAWVMLPPDEPRPASRHPLRAPAHRAEDAAQPLLPGAALHGIRGREAVVAGPAPRRQGRGRLGCGQHRVLHDQRRVRRDALRLGAHVGRRRREGAGRDVRRGAPPRRARRHRALAHRGARREQRVAPARGRSVPDRERLRHGARPARNDRARHPPRAGRLGHSPPSARAPPASTSSTSTGRTPTCPANSCRRTTTAARTPTAARWRTARASGSRRWRRCATPSAATARSRAASPSTAWAGSATTSRRASSSCAWPMTWSISGT